MRIYFLLAFFLVAACKPYEDPAPITDPRLDNSSYCNDPAAINYNWGFPGVPDNSLCIFPADVFIGNYVWRDTILDENRTVLGYDSALVTITKIDTVRFNINGRCGYDLKLTADKFLGIVIDSIDGRGQKFCQPNDTIIGTGLKTGFSDTTTFTLNYVIISDTGSSIHESIFIKQ